VDVSFKMGNLQCLFLKGSFSILSVMTYLSIQKYDGILYGSDKNSQNASQFLDDDPIKAKVKFTMALSFGVGVLLFLSSLFHVGSFTKYLSDPVVNAFTVGSAYHTVISQITGLLGISIPKITSPFLITAVKWIILCNKLLIYKKKFNWPFFFYN
jgi:MFS superfamily sulfate permease-like transporter